MAEQFTLIYDAECGFCRRMLKLVLDWDASADHRLRPIALQEPEATRLLSPMPRAIQMQSWHLVRPDGSVVSRGAALPEALALVKRHKFIARCMRKWPELTDNGYRFVADHRIAFGRLSRRLPDYRA